MKFDAQSLQQGRMNARAAEETPGSFGEANGADVVNSTRDLTKNPRRMAGEMGMRAQQLMSDPVEAQRTQNWMQQFGMSNEGMQFNQAKMMMSQPAPQEQQPQE